MAFIVRDTNPKYGGQCYFVGTRKVKDPHGRDCQAADFGDKGNAKSFARKTDADNVAGHLNKIAGRKQFVVEELSIYNQRYGRQATNGFMGFGTMPAPSGAERGGFKWHGDGDGYNGF
jgi:hypothetical protein